MTKKYQVSRPTLPPTEWLLREYEHMQKTGRVTNGPCVEALELSAASLINTAYDLRPVAFCNGTAALTSILYCVKSRCRKRDIVILPSFTFGATLVAVLTAGFKPYFVDCQEDGTICPAQVFSALLQCSDSVAAVIGVDTFGLPCDIDYLKSVVGSRDYQRNGTVKEGPYIICDSAQSLGAFYNSNVWGTQADFHMFSMSASKPISAGEGGLAWAAESDMRELLLCMRNYGFGEAYKRHDLDYQGVSGRMPELSAVIGIYNISQSRKNFSHRLELYLEYFYHLSKLGIDIMPHEKDGRHSGLCYLVAKFPNRNDISKGLDEFKIETKRYFWPALTSGRHGIHKSTGFSPDSKSYKYSVTNELEKQCLALPFHNHMTIEDVQYICGKIKSLLSK